MQVAIANMTSSEYHKYIIFYIRDELEVTKIFLRKWYALKYIRSRLSHDFFYLHKYSDLRMRKTSNFLKIGIIFYINWPQFSDGHGLRLYGKSSWPEKRTKIRILILYFINRYSKGLWFASPYSSPPLTERVSAIKVIITVSFHFIPI